MIQLISLTLFLCLYHIKAQACPSSIKVRREWSTLSNSEQALYVNAFKALADSGTIQQLSRLHNNGAVAGAIHYVPAFFPWHRLFIYAFEFYVRQLGGQYACFSLPYWDWSNDPTPSDYTNFGEIPELLRTNNQMGGDPNGQCVSSGMFRNGLYDPALHFCLVRDIDYATDPSCNFHQPSSVMDSIDATSVYNNFRNDFEFAPHANPHNCVGGQMSTNYSPDDPYFYLHHAFMDYVYSLWQDCNNYDGVPTNQVTSAMYNGNVNSALYGWSITVGVVLDNANLGVRYEKGPFWSNANVDSVNNCGGASNPVNPNWFVNRRRLKKKGGGRGGSRKSRRKSVAGDSHDRAQKIRAELKKQGYTKKKLIHKLAVKVCEDQQKKRYGFICKMPDYFDDCSSMPLDPNTNDIVITLEELLNKNGITDCMKETRKSYYNWANMTHSLKGLCDGCYDRFCDKSTLKQKCAKEGKDRKDKNIKADYGLIIELPNNNDPGFKNIGGGFQDNDYDGIYDDHFNDNDQGFKYNDDDDQKYVINISGYYGFIIIVALLLVLSIINIAMCYINKNKNYHKVSTVSDTDAI